MLFIFYKKFFHCLLVFLLFCSCNEQDKLSIEKSAATFDIKQAEAAIAQSNQNLMKAIKAGDSLKAASYFTNNAKLMMANRLPVSGTAGIINYIGNAIDSGLKSCNIKTISTWGDSSIVAEEGTYTAFDSTKKEIDKGEYIVLWKQESGNWKMFRNIWTSDLDKPGLLRIQKTSNE